MRGVSLLKKKKLCVLFGGQSSEHDVSLISACNILECIDPDKYDVCKIGITLDGRWLLTECGSEDIKTGRWETDPRSRTAFIAPDSSIHGIVIPSNGSIETVYIDAAFPVLHGLHGEDGTVQGLFELACIPYVGPGVAASACAMDKVLSKMIFDSVGFKQAKWTWITRHALNENKDAFMDDVERDFSYNLFVKPANAGSSIGITKAHNRAELSEALDIAAYHDVKIIVERAVKGREIECAVLGGHDAVASLPGEILPAKEFYDYSAKYSNIGSRTLVPADLPEDTVKAVREFALKVFHVLGCRGMARVDFFVREDGEVVLNEINTIPGFTAISMYPKMWEASGVSYRELVGRLIESAVSRAQEDI